VRVLIAEDYATSRAVLKETIEKFGRGRDRSGRKASGIGLGLYLTRRIVRAYGGELTLAPAPEGGSVFSFELDFAG
jgi:signal transduction histidine kinase